MGESDEHILCVNLGHKMYISYSIYDVSRVVNVDFIFVGCR